MGTRSKCLLTKLAIASALVVVVLTETAVSGQSPVNIRGGGTYTYVPGGISPFELSGTASHLGQYTCYGELALSEEADGSLAGSGIAAFTAANGDVIVGTVDAQVDPEADSEGTIHFSWLDEVTFSDGSVARSTGRFATSRPPGLTAITRCHCPISQPFLCFCPA